MRNGKPVGNEVIPRHPTSPAGTVLAIDLGTSGVRAAIVDADGIILAQVGQEFTGVDLDLEALWSAVCAATRGAIDAAGQPVAVAVAAQLGTVFLDRDLKPVAPAMTWQDRRAQPQAERIATVLGERSVSISGRRPAAEHAAARARWLATHAPADWSRTRWIATIKDFLIARMTGVIVTDPVSASYSLLYDVTELSWSSELSSGADVPLDLLPPVHAAADVAGTVGRAAASATGLQIGIPVAVGGPDGSVGALGAGLVAVGATVDIAGTTDVLLHAVDRPLVDPTGRSLLNAFLIPGLWTVGGPTGMTGGAIAWVCELLGLGSVEEAYRQLDERAEIERGGSDGVRVYPGLTGERFPLWRDDGGAVIAGLRSHHGGSYILQAAEEGCAYLLREGLEALEDLGVLIGSVNISGGVSRRRSTMQLRATVWNREVVPLATTEATTTGTALLAAVGGGLHATVADAATAMVHRGDALSPDRTTTEEWERAYRRWHEGRPVAAEVIS
jgi:sugar (pentulose or hexulose) kinase